MTRGFRCRHRLYGSWLTGHASLQPLSSSSFPSEGRSRYTYDDGGDHSKGDADETDNEDGDDHDFPPSHGHQQQQFYMETQDRMLDSISGTVSTLKAQAGLMGREVLDQVGMLEDLEAGVDRSQNRLDRATKRMNDFIRKNKSESSPDRWVKVDCHRI